MSLPWQRTWQDSTCLQDSLPKTLIHDTQDSYSLCISTLDNVALMLSAITDKDGLRWHSSPNASRANRNAAHVSRPAVAASSELDAPMYAPSEMANMLSPSVSGSSLSDRGRCLSSIERGTLERTSHTMSICWGGKRPEPRWHC